MTIMGPGTIFFLYTLFVGRGGSHTRRARREIILALSKSHVLLRLIMLCCCDGWDATKKSIIPSAAHHQRIAWRKGNDEIMTHTHTHTRPISSVAHPAKRTPPGLRAPVVREEQIVRTSRPRGLGRMGI
jgi:NADH:ubiquinone oxidoreductase subunit